MKRKLNNKGISLVEILVTIAIISLVAIPFLDSFAVGMRINNEARRTADAEQTAQDVAEIFKTMTIKDIVTTYGGVAEADYQDGQDTYTGIVYGKEKDLAGKTYVKGAANEKFYVSAELKADPTLDEAYKFYANKNSVPVMNNLSDSNTILVYDKYTKNDAGLSAGDAKSAVLNINCSYTVTGGEKKYLVKVTVDTYRNDVSDVNKIGQTILVKQKSVDVTEDAPVIYVVPALYDRTGAVESGVKYSSDKLEINYSYDGSLAGADEEKPLHIFLIEQNTQAMRADGSISSSEGDKIIWKDANIRYTITGIAANPTNEYPLNTSLVLYSNIQNFGNSCTAGLTGRLVSAKTGRNTFNLLTDNKEEVNHIYQMEIVVHKDAVDGEVAARLTTTLTK